MPLFLKNTLNACEELSIKQVGICEPLGLSIFDRKWVTIRCCERSEAAQSYQAKQSRTRRVTEGSPKVKTRHYNAFLDCFASLANANLSFLKLIQNFLKKSFQLIVFMLVLSVLNCFTSLSIKAEETAPEPAADAGPHRRDGIYAGFSIVDHIGYVDHFNPFSPELAFSYGLTDIKMRSLSLIGGIYYNGEYRPSIYGAVRLDLDRYVDINLGLVSGYLGSPVVPMALFEIHPWENFGLFFLPGAQKVNGKTEFLPIFGLRATIRVMGLRMNAP